MHKRHDTLRESVESGIIYPEDKMESIRENQGFATNLNTTRYGADGYKSKISKVDGLNDSQSQFKSIPNSQIQHY